MLLHMMRHMESEANVKDILAGQLDFPLSDRGAEDAAELARIVAFDPLPVRILSSPLIRAMQTARPFALRYSLPLQLDARLMEQDLGAFSGRTYAEAEADPAYQKDRSQRWEWRPQNGESYRMIAERLASFFNGLHAEHCQGSGLQGPILIVTHAVTMRLIRAVLENTLPSYPTSLPKNGELWTTDFQRLGHPHKIVPTLPHSAPSHGE
jgi:broad specificity phosphatase PhoE